MKRMTSLLTCFAVLLGTLLPATSVWAQAGRPLERNLKSDVRRGEAVAIRARQLLSRKKAFAKAYADLMSKGLKPAFDEGAIVLAVDVTRTVSFGHQTIVDGDYELSFFPFSGSDGTVWEGIVYGRGPTAEATFATAIDMSSLDPSQWYVVYDTYYPPQPGDGGPGQLLGRSESKSGTQFVPVSYEGYTSSGTPTLAPIGSFRDFILCMLNACLQTAIGCARAGGGARAVLSCTVSGCGVPAILCLAQLLLQA